MKQFLSLDDVPNLSALVSQGLQLKKDPFSDQDLGKNKTLGLIFLNPSLRTRLSTQKAAYNLGMSILTMDFDKDGWGLETSDGTVMNGKAGEHIKEAAAVVAQYCDILAIRCFPLLKNKEQDYAEKLLLDFQRYSKIPLISLESNTLHPLQSLTDVMTIEERKKTAKPKVVLTWAPHIKALPQAVANSFSQWMNQAEVDFVITHPQGYDLAEKFRGNAKVTYDQNEAFSGADFIYAKNWSSYESYGQILTQDPKWMITPEKMILTNQAEFMHCLPARRNLVVADAVLDSPQSIVIEQSGNREFAAQAVLKSILEEIS